ncbi:MAG: right-handed parallel beta-helix repeat-containing protein [Eubacteriales bacterium]|nr:right-handed parallel beta-helix repeat-containing protein [Eubacteriales bacterium]
MRKPVFLISILFLAAIIIIIFSTVPAGANGANNVTPDYTTELNSGIDSDIAADSIDADTNSSITAGIDADIAVDSNIAFADINIDTGIGKDLQSTTVSPGDDIQNAIDSLTDGGTLILNEGIYDTLEAIVLRERKNLTIEGNGEVWINTKGIDHHVISLINCREITLANIKAQHVILEEGDNDPIPDARDGAVVGILGGSKINITDCELVGCGIYGVYAEYTTPLVLERCYLHDNSKSAIHFVTGAGTMYTCIRDCIITENFCSIEVIGDVIVDKEGNNVIERNSPEDYGSSPEDYGS